MMDLILQFLQSPLGVTVVAGLFLIVFKYLPSGWQGFLRDNRGLFVEAVKQAEKLAPAGSKLNAAADYFLKVYQSRTGKNLSAKKLEKVKTELSATHADLEAAGALKAA